MNKQEPSDEKQKQPAGRQRLPGVAVGLRILRILAVLSTLILLALVLVGSLIVVQGQRDETRPADAIVVLHADTLTNAHLAHAQELYQRRLASRLLLVADDPVAVQADLVAEGLPEHALLPVEEPEDNVADFQNIAELARQQGIESILIVSAPSELLLDLKMARDHGLVAHGAPVATVDFEPQTLFQASLNYWQYVLFGSD